MAVRGARRTAGEAPAPRCSFFRGRSKVDPQPSYTPPRHAGPPLGGVSMRVEDVQKVCVLGAGAMGAGVAQVCAEAGFAVAMRDIEQRFVDAGFRRIRGPLMKRVEKGKMTVDEVEAIVSRIRGTTDVAAAVKDAQLVIEAVPEKVELKKQVWAEAERACPPDVG